MEWECVDFRCLASGAAGLLGFAGRSSWLIACGVQGLASFSPGIRVLSLGQHPPAQGAPHSSLIPRHTWQSPLPPPQLEKQTFASFLELARAQWSPQSD